MELLYIWVKELNNLHNAGFKISKRFSCDYDSTRKILHVSDCRESFIDLFHDNSICNVTAVIGKNGSGKSSLLEAVLSAINPRYDAPVELAVFYNTELNSLIYYSNQNIQVEYHEDVSSLPSRESPEINKANKISDIIDVYYYSPIFEPNRKHKIWDFKDVSITSQVDFSVEQMLLGLERNKLNVPGHKDPFKVYKQHEILDAILFASKFELSHEIPFTLPSKFNFSLNIIHLIVETRGIDIRYIYGKILNEFLKISNCGYDEDFATLRNVFFHQFLWSVVLYYVHIASFNPEQMFGSTNNFTQYFSKKSVMVDSDVVIKFFEDEKSKYKTRNKNHFDYLTDFLENACDFIQRFELFLDGNIDNFKLVKRDYSTYSLRELNPQKEPLSQELFSYDLVVDFGGASPLKSELMHIIRAYNILVPYGTDFFIFDWHDLSSGERAYLNLFSKLMAKFGEIESRYRKTEKSRDYVIVLIDEGEAHLHPNWQKRYLYNLVNVLPLIFDSKKIQIILTSHSPFLVSDLPKENILFLSSGTSGECIEIDPPLKGTLGANIHTLFTDSFFMEEGLIGEFAKDLINNRVINTLTKKAPTLEELNFANSIINVIGEPALKAKLIEMFEEKVND